MIKLLPPFVLLIFSTSLTAAGFDCKKASNFIEHTICNDKQLSDLDSQLTIIYRNAIRPENKSRLLLEQRTWLKTKRNLCQDSTCLKEAYTLRIDELSKNQLQKPASDQVIRKHEPKQTSTKPLRKNNAETAVPNLLFPPTKSKTDQNPQKDATVKSLENWESDVLKRIDNLLEKK